jgi:hypothetical protein
MHFFSPTAVSNQNKYICQKSEKTTIIYMHCIVKKISLKKEKEGKGKRKI